MRRNPLPEALLSRRAPSTDGEPRSGGAARDVDAAARVRALKIWLYAAGPGGLVGFLGGAFVGGSVWTGLLGAILAALGVGGLVFALTEGAGWSVGRIHHPSGASTPHRPEYSHAESLVVRKKYDEAMEAYREFIRESPEVPEPYLAIARLLRDELGRYEEAVRWFKRARAESRLGRQHEVLVSREIVEIYRRRMEAPLKAAPELARMRERFADTPEGEWAGRELAEVRERVRRTEAGGRPLIDGAGDGGEDPGERGEERRLENEAES